MNKKLFLLLVICLLIVPTVYAISRSIPRNVYKTIDDRDNINNVVRNRGCWSNWSDYWVMCHSTDTLQLLYGYEVLQYPFHKPVCVSDILVFVNDTWYTWDDAIDNNIVDRYIYVYTGGSNFPEPAEVLNPFQYYVFNAYANCILLFSGE